MTSPETANQPPDFRARIGAITDRTLTPTNIDTYAEDALADLVDVIDEASSYYRATVDAALPSTAFGERIAFQRYGLDGDEVEAVLNRLDGLAQEVAGLDDVIASITVHTDRVIFPPDEGDTLEPTGESPRQFPRRTYPRLKTLLFILSNRYDVDIANREECLVADGLSPGSEVRKESYNLVSVPSLNRTVLVCDESGNATYIFDTALLEAAGIDQRTLEGMSKAQIVQYLTTTQRGGYRLLYDDETFTTQVTALLDTIPELSHLVQANEESGKFLGRYGIPVGMQRRGRIARDLGVTYNAVGQAVAALGEALGNVEYGGQLNSALYSPSQRAQIKDWLASNSYIKEAVAGEEAENRTTASRMATDFSIGRATIQDAIAGVGTAMGATRRERIQGVLTTTYNAGQRRKVRDWLIAHNFVKSDEEAGYVPVSFVADLVGISGRTLRTLIAAHAEEIGVVKTISNQGKQLSPAQQGVLMDILAKGGYLAGPPPEGAVAESNVYKVLGYTRAAAEAAILSGVAGKPGTYMVGVKNARPGEVYTVEQQGLMRRWLAENGYTPKERALGAAASARAVEARLEPENPSS